MTMSKKSASKKNIQILKLFIEKKQDDPKRDDKVNKNNRKKP
jgi:hypothetical protein